MQERGGFMYWILLVIQYVGMAALFFEILYVSRQHSSRIQTLLVMLLYATVFNIAGYTLEMQAATKELAMQSLKFTYLGKPFIIFIMYLFVMEYCGVKLSKKKVNLFFGISVFVAALVFTNEHHSLFIRPFLIQKMDFFRIWYWDMDCFTTCILFLYYISFFLPFTCAFRNIGKTNQKLCASR